LKAPERLKPFRGFESHPRRRPKQQKEPGVTESRSDAQQRFRMSARPPVRALMIASCMAIVGAAVMVLTAVTRSPAGLLWAGGLIMAAAVALAVAALVATQRLQSVVLVDPTALTVVRGQRRSVTAWSDVDEVALRGPQLLVTTRTGERGETIMKPPGTSEVVFASLVSAIRQRLDESRGYRA
jgi:hypothetical protein